MALEQVGFEAVVKGLNGFLGSTRQIEQAQGRVEGSTLKAAEATKVFQKVALGAAAAGAAAVAGIGIAALRSAASFEKGMREVNTIAKLSEAEFKVLSDEVLAFSKEMGIAANEAVPAVYQALSAGVPRENVLDFLRIAGEAAIGGVTELETAVDGLSSVVNAYGESVLDTQKAADIMFKTVELGKTTFDELAFQLADVVPTAVAAGVSFDEVGAALATMTVQGIRTRIATTALRQLLVELQKPGPELAAIMDVVADRIGAADGSFKAMLATGKPLQEILVELGRAAADDGQTFTQVLSSVEASNAALSLTGGAADTAAQHLDAVSRSAGSSRAAFEEMNKSVDRQYEMLKTQLNVALIQLGNAILPVVVGVLGEANETLPDVIDAFGDFAGALAAVGEFAKKNKAPVAAFFAVLATPIILRTVGQLAELTVVSIGLARDAVPAIQTFVRNLVIMTRLGGIQGLITALGPLGVAGAVVGLAAVAAGAVFGFDKLLGAFSKGESAAERMAKQIQGLNQQLSDIDRAVALGSLTDLEGSTRKVADAMAFLIERGRAYLAAQEEINEIGFLSGSEKAKILDASLAKLTEQTEELLRSSGLTAEEVEQVVAGLSAMASESPDSAEGLGLILHAQQNLAGGTRDAKRALDEQAESTKKALSPQEELADRLSGVADKAKEAKDAIKEYDDATKSLADALTVEQLAADAELAALQKQRLELELAGQAGQDARDAEIEGLEKKRRALQDASGDHEKEIRNIDRRIQALRDQSEAEGQAVRDIDARIERLRSERELADLTAQELVAKGRAEEFLKKVRDGSIKTDKDKLAAILDVLEATGQDVSAERDLLGIVPAVTKKLGEQTTALGDASEAAGGVGPAVQGAQQTAGPIFDDWQQSGLDVRAAWDDAINPIDGIGQAALDSAPDFAVLETAATTALDNILASAVAAAQAVADLVVAAGESGETATGTAAGTRSRPPGAPPAPTGIKRQTGGPVLAGQLYRVGETASSPGEWFIPRVSGLVARPQQLQLGGVGGPTFSPQFNVSGATVEQMRIEALRAVDGFFRQMRTEASIGGAPLRAGIG